MPKGNVIELRGARVFHSTVEGRRLTRRTCRKWGEEVLSGVDLTVARGEMLYLIGRVGSGKSTLLKTLYAEIPLLEGEGHVAGFDLTAMRRRDIPRLRRKLGIVFQDYQLLPDRNVVENLRFVLRATGWHNNGDILHRIDEVLGQVGLTNREYKMPFELSGGEQQRLAIARALLNDPVVILADEPTGNLDPEAADGIMRLFGTIAKDGCAIVMSTHNVANIQQYPSRTVRFGKGRVEELDIKAIFNHES
ncbi:MAG: ATP-binding cassette domain-containing protein [Alistipes sp.]|jgi:cell division transport system ATP-binding protein|nr:ATP-binding cassette domain-containing protein [Alistipes sp.]